MPSAGVLNIDASNIFAGLIGHPKQVEASQAGAIAQANAALEIAKLQAKNTSVSTGFNWNYVWYGLAVFILILILILIFKS